GSLTVYDGRVYVPVAGVGEEGQGGSSKYECCTFRGSVNALDANTGTLIWKTYTMEEHKPRGSHNDGVRLRSPAAGEQQRRRAARGPCGGRHLGCSNRGCAPARDLRRDGQRLRRAELEDER